jgi:hypothetical protein
MKTTYLTPALSLPLRGPERGKRSLRLVYDLCLAVQGFKERIRIRRNVFATSNLEKL